MFSSHILEVVIGLIFIVLLFSLIATSLQEILANFWNSRGRMLQEAIYSMTGNAKPKGYRLPQKIVWSAFLLLSLGGIAWAIIQPQHSLHVVILIHSAIFATLSAILLARPITVNAYWSRREELHGVDVEAGKTDPWEPNSAEDPAKFAKQILQNPRFTRLGRKKSIDDLTGYIPGKLFAEIFTETLGESEIAQNKPYEEKVAAMAQNLNLDSATQYIILQFLKNSRGNVELFRDEVARWFDDTMDQVQGWYKREAQRWLFCLGIFLGIGFNVNPFSVAEHLHTSEESRKVLSAAANELVVPKEGDTLTDFKVDLVTSLGSLEEAYMRQRIQSDSFRNVLDIRLQQLLGPGESEVDSSLKAQIRDTAQAVLIRALLQNPENNALYTQGKEIQQRLLEVRAYSPLMGIGWDQEVLEKWNDWELRFIIVHFLGVFLFALAVSLGAPFWFDLLKRFVNIRSAGVRPATQKETDSMIEG